MDEGKSGLGPPAREPELTWRAVLAGCLLGAVLAAANVYTGLKTGFIDGGSITASVLAFAWFRAAKRRYGALENNLTQTISGSAAVMSMVVGVAGPIPALALSGHVAAGSAIVLWGVALGALGVLVALLLRAQLVVAEALPFPTGTATAEVIVAMVTAGGSALRRARTLLIAAVVAGLIGWLRDGPLGLLPQALLLPISVAGVSAQTLSLGVSISPLLLSTGLLIGLRAAASMLVGSLLGWALIAPLLLARGIVLEAEHAKLLDWLMWPGAALMLSSSLTSLGLEWSSLVRGLSDLSSLARGGAAPLDRAPATRASPASATGVETAPGERAARGIARPLFALTLLSVLVVVLVARSAFGLSPLTTLLALALALVLSSVCARSAGETDVAPVGAMGGVTQLVFGGSGNVASIASGAVVSAAASQTAQTLWAFKSGLRLGASLKAQLLGQLLGVGVGALVVVPTYEVVASVYGIGTEKMPAPGVLSWKATADAVQGGLAALPTHAATAALIACAVGVVLTLLARTKLERWLPSPIAMGIGFLTPASLSAAVFVGGLALVWLQARRPAWCEEHVSSLAGGAIAGESLFAVALAALIATGVLGG
jgi:OPT family oligopeptide transporter